MEHDRTPLLFEFLLLQLSVPPLLSLRRLGPSHPFPTQSLLDLVILSIRPTTPPSLYDLVYVITKSCLRNNLLHDASGATSPRQLP